MQSLPTWPRARHATDVLIGLAPLTATFARYLPSGALMPFRLIALALVLIAVAQLWNGQGLPAKRVLGGVLAVGACFVGFGAVAILRFGPASLADGVQVVLVIALSAAVTVLVRHRRTLIFLLSGWLVSTLFSAITGVWEIATGHHLPLNAPANQHAGVIPGWNFIAAFFDNPNLYAYHCALSFLLLPALFVTMPRAWRWVCLPIAVLLLVLLAWTGGRIAVMGLVVGALVWAARHRLSRWLSLAGVFLVAALVWLGAPGFSRISEVVSNVVLEATQEGASVWVRLQLVRAAWWMAQQSGFVGVGPGGFGSWAVRPDNPFPWEQLSNAHWGVSEVVAEYGIVTLIVLVLALGLAVITAWRRSASRTAQVWDLEKVFLFVPVPLIVSLPLLSASHSSWLRQPLSALHVVTLVAFLAWGEVVSAGPDPETDQTELAAADREDESTR